MKLHKISTRQLFQYLLLYIFIQIHGGSLWAYVLRFVDNKPLYILIILIFIIFVRKVRIKFEIFIYLSIVFICYVISALINDGGLFSGDAYSYVLSMIVGMLVAYVMVCIDIKKFPERLIKVVTFFASISIVLYTLQIIFGPEIYNPPLFHFCGIRNTYGYLLYSICKTDYKRNYGIFYEPGVYQILLNFAIYYLTFRSTEVSFSEKKKRVFFGIILVALITTGSTTGYLATVIILSLQIFSNNKSEKKNVLLIMGLVGCFLLFDFVFNTNNSLLNQHLISKFTDMRFSSISNGDYNAISSGGARLFIIEKGLLSLKTNPFWGVGNYGFNNMLVGSFWQNFGTGNALFIQLGKRGMIPVVATLLPIFVCFYKSSKSKIEFLALILLYVNTTLAQSQLVYPMFVIVAVDHLIKNIKFSRAHVYSKAEGST